MLRVFFEGISFWTYKGFGFCFAAYTNFCFSFSSRIYEKYLLTPGLCQLNLKKLIRCFALRQLCTSSLFLSRLQVPIHSAEQPGLTCFSLLCMLVGADHRIHISSVLPVKSCIIFLIGFTSYWKCK